MRIKLWCAQKATNDEPMSYIVLFIYSQNVLQVKSVPLFSSSRLREIEAKSRELLYSGLSNMPLDKSGLEIGPPWVQEKLKSI